MRFWLQPGAQGGSIGTGISQAFDFSGNANHLKQATGSRQPLYDSANAINYNAVWNFDGSDDYMAATGTLSSGTLNLYSVPAANRSASSSDSSVNGDYTAGNSILGSAGAWQPATATVGEYLTMTWARLSQ